MPITKEEFRSEVAQAWEGIARDCGSRDGEGAVDFVEQVFFQLYECNDLDKETRERVLRFDPELRAWALEELKRYG